MMCSAASKTSSATRGTAAAGPTARGTVVVGRRSAGPKPTGADGVGRRSPNVAVVAFSTSLAALAITGYLVVVRHLDPLPAPFRIPWVALAAGFAVADLLAIHVEIGDDAHSFTLSEVPLVIGMFLCVPTGTVLARVLGAFIVLALVQRQRPLKLGFNLSLAALESVCAVATLA